VEEQSAVRSYCAEDYTPAIVWYGKTARRGDARAQYNLGYCYEIGHGVPQDYVEAASWYRRAAEQGLPEAQFRLGLLYYEGYGMPQDIVDAEIWLLRAVERGHAPAHNSLTRLYRNLKVVPQDEADAQAAMLIQQAWLNCAACDSAKLRRSRLRVRDLPRLLTLRYPIRCYGCSKRGFVSAWAALKLPPSATMG
jgi:TPR repeat protein